MNNDFKDYYTILGVTPDASLENIRKARERELGQNWSNPMGRVEIERAYSILSNPTSRKEYDEKLNQDLNAAQIAKRNARTNNEFERVNREFEFFVDPQQLEEEQMQVAKENIIESEVEETQTVAEVENKEVGETQAVAEVENKEVEENKVNEDMEDIYSSSDHEVHNLLEENELDQNKDKEKSSEKLKDEEKLEQQENKTEKNKDEAYIIPIEQKNKEKSQPKELSKLQKGLIIGGSAVFLGLPGLIVSSLAVKKLSGKKLKLHPNKHKKISDIKTQESKLIEEYNKNLDEQINTLLAQKHNNYNLQISKIKYENQIELLQKRIELKLNENVKRGGLIKYKLECVALNNQLETAKENLKNINSKIIDYSKNEKTRNHILNATNKMLYESDAEVKQAQNEKQRFSIKKLNVKKEFWKKTRDFSAKRLKTTRNFVGKIQDGVIKAYDSVRSVKEIFTPYDEIDYINVEPTGKTL